MSRSTLTINFSLVIELLWQAPELLKSTSSDDKDENKSKEGDIYSFGIILSEIITREDPYADYEMEPKGQQRCFLFIVYDSISFLLVVPWNGNR